jgi:hypothetical protein
MAVRTVTAVWALESATERSSQLGHLIPEAMASTRWARVSGLDEKTPLPMRRATMRTTPRTAQTSGRRRARDELLTDEWPWPAG